MNPRAVDPVYPLRMDRRGTPLLSALRFLAVSAVMTCLFGLFFVVVNLVGGEPLTDDLYLAAVLGPAMTAVDPLVQRFGHWVAARTGG